MKNQYDGDINDYRKYGLIRMLTVNPKMPTTVCWMLTPDDNNADGGKIGYLENPNEWKGYDEELFIELYNIVIVRKIRHVNEIENSGILHNCDFFSKEMKSNRKVERETYFAEFDRDLRNVKDKRKNCETKMIFFDPDNGIESQKAKPHRKKYIYLSEIEKYFKEKKKTILIYQHFPMKKREIFIEDEAERIHTITKAPKVYSFKTPHVVFFLVPYDGHDTEFEFERKIKEIETRWGTQIIPRVH